MAQSLAVLDLTGADQTVRFRAWMAANGLKQQDVAARLRISDSHVSYILRGRRGVNAELSAAIARLTGGFVQMPPSNKVGDHVVEQVSQQNETAASRRRKARAA